MVFQECAHAPENYTSTQHYLNTKQAAVYLGLSHQYLEIARHKGGGPQYIKLAKAVRYRLEDLDEWMANHIQKHTADTSLSDASPEPTKIKLFKQLVSEIHIKRYTQEEFSGIVEAIYEEIFNG